MSIYSEHYQLSELFIRQKKQLSIEWQVIWPIVNYLLHKEYYKILLFLLSPALVFWQIYQQINWLTTKSLVRKLSMKNEVIATTHKQRLTCINGVCCFILYKESETSGWIKHSNSWRLWQFDIQQDGMNFLAGDCSAVSYDFCHFEFYFWTEKEICTCFYKKGLFSVFVVRIFLVF